MPRAAQSNAQHVRQPRNRAQHQHVRRGIIAEIAGLVEIRRAAGGHLPAPRGKTAHVHTVALDRRREDHARDHRRR